MHNSGNHHAHLWSFHVCAAKVNIQVDGNKLCNWLDNTFPHNFRSNLDLLELENTFQHHILRSCSRFGWNLYLREFGRSHFLGTLSPGALGSAIIAHWTFSIQEKGLLSNTTLLERPWDATEMMTLVSVGFQGSTYRWCFCLVKQRHWTLPS